MAKAKCRPIVQLCQKADARRPVIFNWTPLCTRFWVGGEGYELDEVVRPTRANGYQLRCTRAGQSSDEEPDWQSPTTAGPVEGDLVDAEYDDGSARWTAEIADEDSIVRKIVDSTWTAPGAVTLDGYAEQSGQGEEKTWAYASATVLGTYRIRNLVTFDDGEKDVGEVDLDIV